ILTAYSAVVRHPRAGRLAVNLLRAGGVDYVVSLDAVAYGFPEVASVPSVYDTPLPLFRVPSPDARAVLAPCPFAPHVQGAWEAMAQASFDPEREIVLVAEGAEAASAGVAAPVRARMVVASRRADRVVLDVLLDEPAWAVLTEMRAPGWTSTVDGAP